MKNIRNIIIFIVMVICIIVVIFKINNRSNLKNEIVFTNNSIDILYDDETRLYYIREEDSNWIRAVSYNKDDLKVYIDNPKYSREIFDKKTEDINYFASWENFDDEIIEE